MEQGLDVDWISELREYLVENEHNAHWDLLVCYHEVGRRIAESGYPIKQVADGLGRQIRTVQRMVQFYTKFPDLNGLPEGKNVTWSRVYKKYLPEEKTSRETRVEPNRDIDSNSMIQETPKPDHFFETTNNLSFLDVKKLAKKYIDNVEPEHKFINIYISEELGWNIKVEASHKVNRGRVATSTCPNKEEGHRGCIQFIQSFQKSRGVKFPHYAKQIGALHRILKAGYTWDQINKQIDKMESDKFWGERGFDLTNVANELGKGGVR